MVQGPDSTLYLRANPQDVGGLAEKLAQFAQQLNDAERSLFMERIRRSLTNSEIASAGSVAADPVVFGAWLNEIVEDGSRWHPEE